MLCSPRLQETGPKPAPPAQDVTIVHVTMILLVIHEERNQSAWLWNIYIATNQLQIADFNKRGDVGLVCKPRRLGGWVDSGPLLCIHNRMAPAMHEWMDRCISISSHQSSDVSHTLMFGKMDRKKGGGEKRWHGMRERNESQRWRNREEDGSFGIFTFVFAWVLRCIIYEINHVIESGSWKQLCCTFSAMIHHDDHEKSDCY